LINTIVDKQSILSLNSISCYAIGVTWSHLQKKRKGTKTPIIAK